ncbi:hypothetical protein EON67_11565 [archaeon]|nr:MAG: hypothetical protein EON67_11565 [archaeon]
MRHTRSKHHAVGAEDARANRSAHAEGRAAATVGGTQGIRCTAPARAPEPRGTHLREGSHIVERRNTDVVRTGCEHCDMCTDARATKARPVAYLDCTPADRAAKKYAGDCAWRVPARAS